MRLQDLIAVAAKCRVVTALSQHHRACRAACPRDCSRTIPPMIRPGIAASILDGLMYGSGDAVIGINPVTDRRRRRVERCCDAR